MRSVRRASLILSVALIVAIAVGYFVRSNELERARDIRLTSAAQVAASELGALVDTVRVATATGAEPDVVADALAAIVPDHGVCVVSADATVCTGTGPTPADVTEHERAWSEEPDVVRDQPARVEVYDRRVTVVAGGRDMSTLVEVPMRPGATVWPTTYLPTGAAGSDFFVEGNTRQTAVPVPGAVGVYMVAAAASDVALPTAEHNFYLTVLTLAVILLVLAGITLVVEHRSLVERASVDRLTQLPNRSEFERAAVQTFAQDGERGACLLLFDLDGFKAVNDTYGHRAGDQVLQVIGRRLRGSVREGDIVARWGGDEFVVLLPGVTTAEMGARRARQLAEEVAGRTRIDGVAESLRIRTSVGVALWPEHGKDLDQLVAAADEAMYEAKRSGTVTRVCTGDETPPIEPMVATPTAAAR